MGRRGQEIVGRLPVERMWPNLINTMRTSLHPTRAQRSGARTRTQHRGTRTRTQHRGTRTRKDFDRGSSLRLRKDIANGIY